MSNITPNILDTDSFLDLRSRWIESAGTGSRAEKKLSSAMLQQFEALILQLVNRSRLSEDDKEELKNDCRLKVLHGIKKWDKTKGKSISSYIYKIIHNEVLSKIRQSATETDREICVEDSTFDFLEGTSNADWQSAMVDGNGEECLNVIRKHLDSTTYHYFILRILHGYPWEDIAEMPHPDFPASANVKLGDNKFGKHNDAARLKITRAVPNIKYDLVQLPAFQKYDIEHGR